MTNSTTMHGWSVYNGGKRLGFEVSVSAHGLKSDVWRSSNLNVLI